MGRTPSIQRAKVTATCSLLETMRLTSIPVSLVGLSTVSQNACIFTCWMVLGVIRSQARLRASRSSGAPPCPGAPPPASFPQATVDTEPSLPTTHHTARVVSGPLDMLSIRHGPRGPFTKGGLLGLRGSRARSLPRGTPAQSLPAQRHPRTVSRHVVSGLWVGESVQRTCGCIDHQFSRPRLRPWLPASLRAAAPPRSGASVHANREGAPRALPTTPFHGGCSTTDA